MGFRGFLRFIFGPSRNSSEQKRTQETPLSSVPIAVAEDKELHQAIRTCWIPIVADGDGTPIASKFSGVPYIKAGESWPMCPNCGKAMQLFLQLNPRDLPNECQDLWGEGVLQFFYCTSNKPLCEVECESFFAFSRSTLLRIVQLADERDKINTGPIDGAFPPKRIVGWSAADDYPNWEELEELGIQVSNSKIEELCEKGYPRAGEKLLGWPAWVQGVEYPLCPQCQGRMQLVFQIDSEGALPYMFGDMGCGHISQCPTHREILAFGWACS